MHYRDERALQLLELHSDEQNVVTIDLNRLAELLGCERHTASRITDRLEGAGLIIKHQDGSRFARGHKMKLIKGSADGGTRTD